jgi:hypothetical protein
VVVLNVGEPGLASFRLNVDGMQSVAGGAQGVTERRRTAQVGFSSEGSMLVITARGTDSILTYQVAANGTFGEGFQCAGNRTLCGHSLDADGS